MFAKNRYKNSETYKRIEKEIDDIIGIEEHQKIKKSIRNDRLKRYTLVAIGTAGAIGAAFVAGAVSASKSENNEN